MYEQDYIMRLIKERVRALLKILFGIETKSQVEELLQETEWKQAYGALLDMVDNGDINGAENRLYDLLAGDDAAGDMEKCKMAVLFYAYLNEQSDAFLKEHDYSREEIRQGLESLLERYGIQGMGDAFLEESGENRIAVFPKRG